MHIHLPDPHPGRCQNLRVLTHPSGKIEHLRCLDYEGTDHKCVFPTVALEPMSTGASFQTSEAPKPKPWVKPDGI